MKVLKYGLHLLCLMLQLNLFENQELDEGEGGNFLFLSTNDEVADESHAADKGRGKPDCEEFTLISFLSSLQVINPESVIALAAKNKLENKCHNISKTINHMESYLKTCNLEVDQQQYVNLLNGVKVLHQKLCTKNPYHKTFLEHKKCYGQLQSEIADSCDGPADWSDSSDSKRVCRAYQEIKDCYYIKASILCGEKAANIYKQLVQKIIESVITVNCTLVAFEEETAKMSKEQKLLMQRKKLSQASSEGFDESASPPPLYSSGSFHLLCVLFSVYVAKLIQNVIHNQVNAGSYL